MKHQEFYIPCDGLKIHAKLDFPQPDQQTFPLLIILHGLTGHMEERHIIAAKDTAIACGFVTLRVDLYGHGKSDGEFENHTILHWLLETMRIIRYAEDLPYINDIYLSGHSQGGLTAILAAGMMPHSIKGLIPMSPATILVSAPEKVWKKTNEHKHLQLNEDYFLTAHILPLEKCIKNYHGPILLIHGTTDQTVPLSYAERLAEKEAKESEDFQFVKINGADHCYTHPGNLEAFKNILKDFLSKRTPHD